MTGPASPAHELAPWLRAAYGRPLPAGASRHVVDTAPDGTVATDTYETPYWTAIELQEDNCRQLEQAGRPHSVTFHNGGSTVTYTDDRGHTITTTYTDLENQT